MNFKIEDKDTNKIVQLILGCENMPEFFLADLFTKIDKLCFGRMRKDEDPDIREAIIEEVWNAVKSCNEIYIVSRFVKFALNNNKTPEKIARDICLEISGNYPNLFAEISDLGIGYEWYGKYMLYGVHRYYSLAWSKIKKKTSEIEKSEAYEILVQEMNETIKVMNDALR